MPPELPTLPTLPTLPALPALAASIRPSDAPGLRPLYSVAQVRDVEVAAMATLAPHALMHRAAQAAAACALRLLDAAAPASTGMPTPAAQVLIAAGTGNNGGDALECAALLAGHGCAVTVLLPVPAPPGASADHAQALAGVAALGERIHIMRGTQGLDVLAARSWDLTIDGLFGIGLTRPLEPPWSTVAAMLNGIAAPLLALDVPSGLDADTGCVLFDMQTGKATGSQAGQHVAMPGADAGHCVRATHTITFIGDKPGLHTGSGREMAGEVTLASLDIDAGLFPVPLAWRNDPTAFPMMSTQRRQDSHKGSYGDVCIIGGASGMAGAAILAAQAALKSGCGRVTIGFAQQDGAPAFIAGQPELMCHAAGSGTDSMLLQPSTATFVVGPGLGREAGAAALVEQACSGTMPLVLDADALNLIAMSPSLQSRLAARDGPAILTPHPLEAARLLGITVAEVQADRLQAARSLAQRFRATVVLKGSGSVIVDGEQVLINPTGNPALATGGTGDVLAGMCGALLAQGFAPLAAAAGAVWLHGAAADWLVAHGIGPIGVTAGEIIDAARTVRNQLAMSGAARRRQRRAGLETDDLDADDPVKPQAPAGRP